MNVSLIFAKIMERVWVTWAISHASVKMDGKVERVIWETATVIGVHAEMEELASTWAIDFFASVPNCGKE